MVGYDDGEDKVVDDVALQDRQNVIVVDMVVRESGLWPISMNHRYPPHDECGILKAGQLHDVKSDNQYDQGYHRYFAQNLRYTPHPSPQGTLRKTTGQPRTAFAQKEIQAI